MFLEYDWTFGVYRARFGTSFIDVLGWRSFETKDDAASVLAQAGLKIGRKTDSCTWAIETAARLTAQDRANEVAQ